MTPASTVWSVANTCSTRQRPSLQQGQVLNSKRDTRRMRACASSRACASRCGCATESAIQLNTCSMRQRRQPRPHFGDPCGIEFGQHQAFAFGQHADHLAPGIDDHAVAPGAAAVFEGVGVTRGSSLNTIQLRNLFSATRGSCTELS